MLFADLLSLHLVTFLMFFNLVSDITILVKQTCKFQAAQPCLYYGFCAVQLRELLVEYYYAFRYLGLWCYAFYYIPYIVLTCPKTKMLYYTVFLDSTQRG